MITFLALIGAFILGAVVGVIVLCWAASRGNFLPW